MNSSFLPSDASLGGSSRAVVHALQALKRRISNLETENVQLRVLLQSSREDAEKARRKAEKATSFEKKCAEYSKKISQFDALETEFQLVSHKLQLAEAKAKEEKALRSEMESSRLQTESFIQKLVTVNEGLVQQVSTRLRVPPAAKTSLPRSNSSRSLGTNKYKLLRMSNELNKMMTKTTKKKKIPAKKKPAKSLSRASAKSFCVARTSVAARKAMQTIDEAEETEEEEDVKLVNSDFDGLSVASDLGTIVKGLEGELSELNTEYIGLLAKVQSGEPCPRLTEVLAALQEKVCGASPHNADAVQSKSLATLKQSMAH